MIYRFKENEMVLTKVQGFTTFKHFSTVCNAPIVLIY